jgi:Cdc6-like AAA superfamily ATPase
LHWVERAGPRSRHSGSSPGPSSEPSSSPAEPLLRTIQYQLCFAGAEALSAEFKRWIVDLENPENPFHSLIGQEHVKRRLARLAFQALGRPDHCARDLSLALLGPTGTGKTTFAKAFCRLLASISTAQAPANSHSGIHYSHFV